MGTVPVADILTRASIVLQDKTNTRWPTSELEYWLNDGQREIALHKPSAVASVEEISLSRGTYQTLGSGYVSIQRMLRNLETVAADAAGRTGGRHVTPVTRDILDQQLPNWHDPSVVPYDSVVKHVIWDIADPRSFWVYPGNDGTGVVEAVVASMPTDVSTGETINVPDIYRNALVDFICYRCLSYDANLAGAMQRAVAHYQMFAAAIGLKSASDAAENLNTTQP